MVKPGKFSKLSVVPVMLCLMLITVADIAFAATYDLTGGWTVTEVRTSETCGVPLTTDIYSATATQTGNAWSATDQFGDTVSGSVSADFYSGSGTKPHGPIGLVTSVDTKVTFIDFTLATANSGSGTQTENFNLQGVTQCTISSNITLTRTTTPTTTTPATTVNTPQVLRTTTTNIVNLVNKRIRTTIGHVARKMMTDATPVIPGVTVNETSAPSENGLVAQDELTNQFKSVQLDINNTNLGLSAGSADQKMGVWGNIALTFSDNDLAATASDIDIKTYIAGFDYRLFENVVAGVALSYDNTDATNTYNNGDSDADSYSLVPYISYLINDNLSIEALYGHSWVDTDQMRNSNITSSPSSHKDFMSGSINAYKSLSNFNFTGNMSYTWAKEEIDGFNEFQNGALKGTVAAQRIKFSQFGLGLEVSYLINKFEPYASIAYENDVTHTDIAGVIYDTEGGNFGLGVRMELMDSLSGDLDYNQTINRDNLDEYTVSANVRYDF